MGKVSKQLVGVSASKIILLIIGAGGKSEFNIFIFGMSGGKKGCKRGTDHHPNKTASFSKQLPETKDLQAFQGKGWHRAGDGHFKQDHRMSRNYLLDELGDLINTLLAAAGFNLRKMLQRLKAGALKIFARLIWFVFGPVWNRKFAS